MGASVREWRTKEATRAESFYTFWKEKVNLWRMDRTEGFGPESVVKEQWRGWGLAEQGLLAHTQASFQFVLSVHFSPSCQCFFQYDSLKNVVDALWILLGAPSIREKASPANSSNMHFVRTGFLKRPVDGICCLYGSPSWLRQPNTWARP